MYGQGSYAHAPQYRQGLPAPPPQQHFPQPPPGPPLPYQQTLPPPPVYHHGLPLPPPQAAPQPYMHPPPPLYAQAGQPYMQQRMLPPPLPQGQIMYRNLLPPPPPMGMHHVPSPPPPPPSSFISITPAPYMSFVHPPAGDVHLPSGPPPSPPPLPPSPPPPQPSSPPPAPLMADIPVITVNETCKESEDNAGDSLVSASPTIDAQKHDSSPRGEVGNNEQGTLLVQEQESHNLHSPPPRPDEEVVRNIEELCRFIAEVGPDFESLARTKEMGNPQFAFLFGGEPGSTAAIGYEYFHWVKRKYHFQMKSQKDSERDALPSETERPSRAGNIKVESSAASPAMSDMDMEYDSTPEGDMGYANLNEESRRDPKSGSSEVNPANEPLHASQTAEQLEPVVPISGTASSGLLPPLQIGEDGKNSSANEDVSPIRTLPESAECISRGINRLVGTSTGNSILANVLPAASDVEALENPRVFVKDRSPFRLIQGYASDDSDEGDNHENAERVIPASASLAPDLNIRHVVSSIEDRSENRVDLITLITSTVSKETASFTGSSPKEITSPIVSSNPVDLFNGKKVEDKTEASELFPDINTLEDGSNEPEHQAGKNDDKEDVKQDSTMLDVDEFGRLVKKDGSDSDSDGMLYNERHTRGRNWSWSPSPQERRWRRRSRSPRRRHDHSRSPSWSPRSRSKSPSASRHANVFSRRDWDQRPECSNFLRGRCFRGASCRFLHRGFGRHRSRQQEYQEYQQSGNDNMHGNVPAPGSYIDKTVVTETDVKECNAVPLEEEKHPEIEDCKDVSETSSKMLIENEPTDSALEGAQPIAKEDFCDMRVTYQVAKGESQVQEAEQTNTLTDTFIVNSTEEGMVQNVPEPSEPIQADSLQSKPLPADTVQSLFDETVAEQHNSEEGISVQPSHPVFSTITSEQPQNVTQYAYGEGQMLHPLPAESIQSTIFQHQNEETNAYLAPASVTSTYPSQGSGNQSYSNYVQMNQSPELSLPYPAVSFQPTQLPLPPPPRPPQGHPPPVFSLDNTNVQFASHQPRSNLLPPVTSHQSQFISASNFSSHGYRITSDYNAQRYPAPNPRWSNLPPPDSTTLPIRPVLPPVEPPSSQYAQNVLLPTGNFNPQLVMRPVPPGDHIHPQMVDFRGPVLLQSSHQLPPRTDDSRWMPLPMGSAHDQPFARDNRFPQPSVSDSQIISDSQRDHHLHHQPSFHAEVRTLVAVHGYNSSPFDQDAGMRHESMPFTREPFPNGPHMFREDHMLPRPFSKEQFPPVHGLPHRPPYGSQHHPDSNNFRLNLGGTGVDDNVTRYPSSFGEGRLPPYFSDIGISKMPILIHHNPYASTFEQIPPSSKFAPSISLRENDRNYSFRYGSSFNPGNAPASEPGQGVTSSPSNSRRSADQLTVPRPDVFPHETHVEALPDVQKHSENKSAEAYDPLFDSIEPSSNAFKTLDHAKGNMIIDDDERALQKGGVAAEVKSEADEFGEVATDAEVGVVENGSPSPDVGKDWSPDVQADAVNPTAGEIEIDQVRSPGKSKKSKDSRSMKLFKVALADFVKEVLKPSWRQGNMSKEAFKTIVKKTVDKVSGTMPSHQVPKTQVKINQYVESSQRKLTKLVMGYVDKYVKV